MYRFVLAFTALITLSLAAIAEPTYGERLGWKADDRVLIIGHKTHFG